MTSFSSNVKRTALFHRWEKVIYRILLLINLTSCVCGTFVVNVTQTSYQAEENHNITLEWIFTTKTGSSLHSLYIYCELLTDLRPSALFRLHEGVEVPESQDEQFKGRVQCDKDVLREGRLRLHVSRLRTDDSGLYMCEVSTRYGSSIATCRLNVTAAETVRLQPGSCERIGLYVGLGLPAALVLLVCVGLALRRTTGDLTKTNHFIRIRAAVDLVNILREEVVVVVDKNNHSRVHIDNRLPEETVESFCCSVQEQWHQSQ